MPSINAIERRERSASVVTRNVFDLRTIIIAKVRAGTNGLPVHELIRNLHHVIASQYNRGEIGRFFDNLILIL